MSSIDDFNAVFKEMFSSRGIQPTHILLSPQGHVMANGLLGFNFKGRHVQPARPSWMVLVNTLGDGPILLGTPVNNNDDCPRGELFVFHRDKFEPAEAATGFPEGYGFVDRNDMIPFSAEVMSPYTGLLETDDLPF